jgi:hypothetical protein
MAVDLFTFNRHVGGERGRNSSDHRFGTFDLARALTVAFGFLGFFFACVASNSSNRRFNSRNSMSFSDSASVPGFLLTNLSTIASGDIAADCTPDNPFVSALCTR